MSGWAQRQAEDAEREREAFEEDRALRLKYEEALVAIAMAAHDGIRHKNPAAPISALISIKKMCADLGMPES